MSLAGYQRALLELVITPALRQEVARLPFPELPAALDTFPLTEQERRRLHAIAGDRGMRVATMLHRATRLSRLSNSIPRTCETLGAQKLREMVHRFWKENPPTTAMFVQEARSFIEFLRERRRTGEWDHELMPDLMEAELVIAELAKQGPVAPPTRAAPPEGALLEASLPTLSPWCRVVPFQRDARAVLAQLGGDPARLPSGELYLVAEGIAPGSVSLHVVNAERGRALLASTGERSVADLSASQGTSGTLFHELAGRGFLLLSA